MRPLVPLPPPQERAVVKHVLGQGVQGPEVPLAGVARLSWHLDKAVIETQIVADGVLPLGELFLVIREPLLDKLADAAEGEPLVGGLEDGHADQGDVGVRRLDHARLLVLIETLVMNILAGLVILLITVHLVTDVSLMMMRECSRIKNNVVSRLLLHRRPGSRKVAEIHPLLCVYSFLIL